MSTPTTELFRDTIMLAAWCAAGQITEEDAKGITAIQLQDGQIIATQEKIPVASRYILSVWDIIIGYAEEMGLNIGFHQVCDQALYLYAQANPYFAVYSVFSQAHENWLAAEKKRARDKAYQLRRQLRRITN
jgi:hypothetical protein